MKMNVIKMMKAMRIELFVCFMTCLISYVISYVIVLFLYLVGLFICSLFNRYNMKKNYFILIHVDFVIIIFVLLKLHIWLLSVKNRNNLRGKKYFAIYK